ncbi:MAG: diphosphate--fructose-6-phosphate 1-phosphotransferase [Candidatus Ornithospirochaeta sp.]|nr:diphosphate--fructose-6-phosphate 1-phosphotransferase [Sphaerochaetaceae bacterium]MDY5522924.1 diphosphate--fructose-6-phosphate 1-phosphotransferase [Candidatus Ornithospirochaeta sp.]
MGKNILVAHGGGPTAVINTSLQGVIETARVNGGFGKIYGAKFGAEGILKNDLLDLTNIPSSTVGKLSHTPATAIGSCRRKLSDKDYPAVIECMKKNDIGVFFYNGGNDSMDTCNKISILAEKEGLDLQVIGIPKTMDNDLAHTDNCPGFGSAARYAAINASELALDANGLPIHVVVMELMGRNAGWVTAASALAARVTNCEVLTYLPEKLVDVDEMLRDIEKAYSKGRGCLVTVSEGLCGLDGNPLADTGIVDGFGHKVAGGVGEFISRQIMDKVGLKSRSEKPGLIGRTSIAYQSEVDREEAYAVGKRAVEAAAAGKTGSMVSIVADRTEGFKFTLDLVPLSLVANVEKKFPLEWIEGTNKISDKFFEYCSPLMGSAPDFAIFR